MNYLIDTNILSELRKPQPLKSVVDWLNKTSSQNFFVSVLTLGEIEKGINRLKESKKKQSIRTWFENVLMDYFYGRILSIDEKVARVWGIIHSESEKRGRPLPVIDGLLAATAFHHNLTLVTRNTKDVDVPGVNVFDPWTTQA